MSVKPDTTSPYAQPPQYGNRSPGLSGEVGDEEESPQPAFSYLVGHTPDQLYGNVSPTEHHSGTLPPGSSNTLSPNGPREDWLPPLQAGGNVKRGLPRHTFSDVGQSNPGFNPNEYTQIDNGRHNSTGNLPPNQGGQAPGDVGCYATTGRGQPRNSNYPSEFTAVGPNPADRKTGHYDGFTDRQTGHYEAFPRQTIAAVDIGMNDMSPSANGPGDDRYEAVGYPSDSMKRNRGMRPTTKQSHLGKLSSVSEEPPREPPKYGCLCIFAIVVAVVVALAAGFAAGWFLHGTGATGGATTATLVQTSTIRTTPTSKPTTTTTTTTMTISTAAPPPSTPDTLTTSTPHVTTAKQTMASTITTSEAAKQTTAATTATTEATTTPQTTTTA